MPRRVAEERDDDQTPLAVDMERSFYLPIGEEMVPIFAEMPFPFISPLARELQLQSENKKGVLGEKLIPPGMVEMGGEIPHVECLEVGDRLSPAERTPDFSSPRSSKALAGPSHRAVAS